MVETAVIRVGSLFQVELFAFDRCFFKLYDSKECAEVSGEQQHETFRDIQRGRSSYSDPDDYMKKLVAWFGWQEKDMGKTADLFKIKENITFGQCSAMRCKSTPSRMVDGAPWEHPGYRIPLCETHQAKAPRSIEVLEAIDEQGNSVGQVAVSTTAIVPRAPGTDVDDPELAQLVVKGIEALTSRESEIPDVEGLEIIGQELVQMASDMLHEVKEQLEDLKALETAMTAHLATELSELRAMFSPPKKIGEKLVRVLKDKIATAKELEELHNAELVAQAEAQQVAGNIEGAIEALSDVQHISDVQGISIQRRWTFEVQELAEVPLAFIEVNSKAVREHMKGCGPAGPKHIPGIRFYQVSGVVARGVS